jgi:molybdopterin/thiamine biosynthesis adenylyltransferase
MSITPTSPMELHSRARRAGYEPAALDAAVAVVGVGAIGQNTAQTLALTGVRELRLIDADHFEAHNLTRSPLFPPGAREREGELGKAPLCAEVLAGIATHPEAVIRYAATWVEELGAAAFAGVAAVACCVDSLRARAYINDRCRQLSLPMIEAGFGGPELTVGIYPADHQTACWRCGKVVHDEVVSCRVAAAAAERSGVVPAIQTAAAVAGGMQAEAVVQALHGRLEQAQRLWLNVRSGEGTAATLLKDPLCHHRAQPAVVDLDLAVDAPLGALLDATSTLLGGAAELELPSPYVTHATCGACGATIDVSAPGHRYVRDPRCVSCGGPWTAAPGVAPENSVAYLTDRHPLVVKTCAELGLRPGEVIVASNMAAEVAVRLRGGPAELFCAAERSAAKEADD